MVGMPLVQALFHRLCTQPCSTRHENDELYFQTSYAGSARFFDRFDSSLELAGKTVLDVGCGFGSTCLYMAQQGAARVVGLDIDPHRVAYAKAKAARDFPALTGVLDFRVIRCLSDIGAEQFDLIISKDSFEHYDDPAAFVAEARAHLAERGSLVVGFGPLWKSPFGGHISYMTRLPWAHLLFPEAVIMAERKRFRPYDPVERFDQIAGGINKMTLARFHAIMAASGLECRYLRTNVSSKKLVSVCRPLSRLPFLTEYFTVNVYGIWQPSNTSS